MPSSEPTSGSDRFHVKGLARKIKKRFGQAKAHLAARHPAQAGSNREGARGPLSPVLEHIALSLSLTHVSIPVAIPFHSSSSRTRTTSSSTVSTQSTTLSKVRDIFSSTPSSISEAPEEDSVSRSESERIMSVDSMSLTPPSGSPSDPQGEKEEHEEHEEQIGETAVEADRDGRAESAKEPDDSPEPDVAPEPPSPSSSQDNEPSEAISSIPDEPPASNEMLISSPDPQTIELEGLDPFLVDDPDNPVSDSEPPTARPPPSNHHLPSSLARFHLLRRSLSPFRHPRCRTQPLPDLILTSRSPSLPLRHPTRNHPSQTHL